MKIRIVNWAQNTNLIKNAPIFSYMRKPSAIKLGAAHIRFIKLRIGVKGAPRRKVIKTVTHEAYNKYITH